MVKPDDAVRAAYRGLPREEPPSAVDAAVLAAARRSVVVRPAHHWRIPASLAAVLVLSVAVTLRVADEQPEIQTTPPSMSAPQGPAAPAAAKPVSGSDLPVATPAPRAKAQLRREPAPSSRTAMSESSAPAAEQSSGLIAQQSGRADQRAPMRAKSGAEASSLASGAPLLPEAWLERIVELRAKSRHKEADESYAEFRRRYPDYAIPAETLQKISPLRQ